MNGVDTRRFAPDPDARARLRATLGFADGAPVFATVTVLRPGKGIQHLIEAAALLRTRAEGARVLVVGDGEERATLERQAAALCLDDMLLFVGLRTDVPALLAAADVYVQPSLFEALPVSVLEAMAVGLPVLATAVGGVPEMVAHGTSGLLVPPARPDALAEAMAQVLDGATRAAMGASGRAWVEQHASTDVWLDQLQRAYTRALRSSA